MFYKVYNIKENVYLGKKLIKKPMENDFIIFKEYPKSKYTIEGFKTNKKSHQVLFKIKLVTKNTIFVEKSSFSDLTKKLEGELENDK